MGKILDKLQETIDKFTETAGTPPYALVCNKKTYEVIAQELYQTLRWEKTQHFNKPPSSTASTKAVRLEMRFSNILIIQNNDAPGNKVYAMDKKTYEEIMDIAKPTSSGEIPK